MWIHTEYRMVSWFQYEAVVMKFYVCFLAFRYRHDWKFSALSHLCWVLNLDQNFPFNVFMFLVFFVVGCFQIWISCVYFSISSINKFHTTVEYFKQKTE